MITQLIEESKVKQLRVLIERSENIVITCHISPDGDAIGSSLGLARVLDSTGRSVKVITPDVPPKNLMFLPGAKEIVVYSKYPEFAEQLVGKADLIFALDYNELKRIDLLGKSVAEASAPIALIDHHLSPGDFAEVVISHPEVSSTSMLVFRTLCRLGLFASIDKKAAECIFTGMMTDTGNFSYNSNDPDLYIVVSELIKKGIDKDAIYSRVYNSNTVGRLRLNGYAIDRKMRVYDSHRCALIVLSREELNRYNYQKGDTEQLVNVPLSVPEITYSIFMREESDYIKVSARSKGNFPVNEICREYFNGGGHRNAAGGELHCSLDEAVAIFESILDSNDRYLH